jgi:putative hydrolases of HD superfamily
VAFYNAQTPGKFCYTKIMTTPDPLLFSLQQMTIDLSLIKRNHHLAKTDQKENDIEHSLTVALLCWYIHDRHHLELDISKILKYAITHDFVERYAGDVNTFASQKEREQKVVNEQASLERLSVEYKDFPDMISSMRNYESKQDEESNFVWTVDKMQGMIMGDMDDWRPYASINITYDQFVGKHGEHLKKSSKYCKEIFESLLEYCKTTYYDQPPPQVVEA